jgi:AcrR family transcriptional regulator
MARPRDDDVRRAAVEATIESVAAKGIGSLSLREVARRVGVSTGTLSHHFGSKRSMLLESISYGYWHLPGWFEHRPAVHSMRFVLGRYDLTTPKRRSWWRFWLAISSYAQADDELKTLMLREYRSVEDRWAGALARGQTEGVFVLDFDARTTAVRLAALAHGIAVAQLVGAMAPTAARAELSTTFESLCTPAGLSALENLSSGQASRLI